MNHRPTEHRANRSIAPSEHANRTDPIFALLSFEGPDPYSKAGGLGSRVTELSEALARLGYETHLFFVGDPSLPGSEARFDGNLTVHRWCQWISQYHPGGVYDGEEGKWRDWNTSLPPWLASNLLAPAVARGKEVVVLAEEWHTAASIVALGSIVADEGWEPSVHLLWNANNTFGFDRVDWELLQHSATITTVSRYMRTLLALRGVEARVVANGIAASWFERNGEFGYPALSDAFRGRLVMTKIARWDPDKNWTMAIQAVGAARRMGMQPLLLARGGLEPYGSEVLRQAQGQGLGVRRVGWCRPGVGPMLDALGQVGDADVILLDRSLNQEEAKYLYRSSFAVLANSEREPFGLVGLETMASGGVAFVGSIGEDYATNGHDAVCLQSKDPWEVVRYLSQLIDNPARAIAMRQAARASAARFNWEAVVKRVLIPSLGLPLPMQLNPCGRMARARQPGQGTRGLTAVA